ncbi:penicillin-binding protein 4B [Pullulanibacillus camelliae]|uniref:Penicillin-binding protein 4B n=1 Tax=Pullulanibacillus camelliae TaxID=1707096 RepID=A0A8J2YHN7_9BACL|nr:penicillin-binding transpeptidase domain-containing protein [Pullulanibacillus camelliae]GGE43091.1 penicillin-binding protein 4B [Pullulanibacillus camelliae]
MRNRRIMFIGIAILLIFAGFICRLAQIQLFATTSFSRAHVNLITQSITQRTSQFVINNGRGILLDRTGKVKLNDVEQPALVLFPFLKNRKWPVEKLARIINVPAADMTSAIKRAKEAFVFRGQSLKLTKEQMKQINQLHIVGVQALKVRQPSKEWSDSYVLGTTKENPTAIQKLYPDLLKNGNVTTQTPIGVLGMEKAFDPFLLSKNETKLLYHTSASGEPLFDNSVRVSSKANTEYYPLKVKTTLDTAIQKLAEQAAAKHGLKKGGVVILDAVTSDLLSMVSLPQMDAHHPFANGNQMLKAQYPGSVFKIVTAAAAIQNNLVNDEETFNCNLNPYGTGQGERQLGALNFEDSFAQSCNYTFATLANRLMETDDQTLTRFGKALGLTDKVGWTDDVFRLQNFQQFPDEESNVIWAKGADHHDSKAIAQTAIGQLNVRLTPLSVANMMATISRGGEKQSVRSATEVDYNQPSGVKLTTFPKEGLGDSRLESYTILRLQALLRDVVKDKKGTGHALADASYPVAGKSGTAETDKGHTNEWFAGYFPADDPKYAMVVVNLDHHPGDHKTYEIYHDLVDDLHQLDEARHS